MGRSEVSFIGKPNVVAGKIKAQNRRAPLYPKHAARERSKETRRAPRNKNNISRNCRCFAPCPGLFLVGTAVSDRSERPNEPTDIPPSRAGPHRD